MEVENNAPSIPMAEHILRSFSEFNQDQSTEELGTDLMISKPARPYNLPILWASSEADGRGKRTCHGIASQSTAKSRK